MVSTPNPLPRRPLPLLTRAALVASGALLLALLLWITRPHLPTGAFLAACDAEFLTRPDGLSGLTQRYDLRLPAPPLQMDPGLMYRCLADGSVDVINAFATDGRIRAYDLLVLEDDRGFFPPYEAVPVVRAATLARHPRLRDALDALAGRISTAQMQRLNFQVDEKGLLARDVARRFLQRKGLLPRSPAPARPDAPAVTVGGKQFTEQEILGEMLCQLIGAHTGLPVIRRLNLGGTMICFNALTAGDIDVYVEYTGTACLNILAQKMPRAHADLLPRVRQAFAGRYHLVVLDPLGFDNTYTLAMRREHAQRLNITSISDLAAYLDSNAAN